MFFLVTRNRSIKRSVISTDSPGFHTENIRGFLPWHRWLQVAKRQEDTSGWCSMWRGGKMPKGKFLKMVFPNPLFSSKSPFGGENSYATILDPPPKMLKRLMFRASFLRLTVHWQPEQRVKITANTLRTVDGQNPAPPIMMIIPLFIGFSPSQVVQDFVHQQ